VASGVTDGVPVAAAVPVGSDVPVRADVAVADPVADAVGGSTVGPVGVGLGPEVCVTVTSRVGVADVAVGLGEADGPPVAVMVGEAVVVGEAVEDGSAVGVALGVAVAL
jgi:hypothetical protein